LKATFRPLAIAQIGTVDHGGGAATVAAGLMKGFQAHGHHVWHVVGRKQAADPNVIQLPDDDRLAFRVSGYAAVQSSLQALAGRFPSRGFGLASRGLRLLTHPRAITSWRDGVEDFEFPGTRRLFDRLGRVPDIVHGHNLHGGYFDLRALASISARVPTLLTLHDMWLLTGHCAYSLDCKRWKTGCGACPDLSLSPPIRRDATAENWRRKQQIYKGSRLHVATPSRWLRDQVADSILASHPARVRVIPNGVDTTVFHARHRERARQAVGLPSGRLVVLLTVGSGGSMWKDERTLHEVIGRLMALAPHREIEFVALGRGPSFAAHAPAVIRSIPYQGDPTVMANYYRSADVYLHAALADTFPLAILEAMACGTPVVATAVGGIPEQVRPVDIRALTPVITGALGDATGMVVPSGVGAEMARAVDALLAKPEARASLGDNAVKCITDRFTLERQIDAYLAWYAELCEEQPGPRPS
jgi:glycosyltransferase involved in cell wall biosynthesis